MTNIAESLILAFTSPDSGNTTALNRRESLLHYLQHPPVAPGELPGGTDSPSAKADYDHRRMDYYSGGIVLATDSAMKGKLMLTRAFQENRARNSGHAGVILSGDSSLGKTTMAKRLMSWVLAEYTKQVPDWQQFEHVPVMYIEIPPGSNGKALLKEMAAFFGLPALTRDSMTDLRTKVVAAIRRARTQLIVVDELHNLAGRSSGLGESVDLLKGLHNDVNATFLYCGIDVTTSNLMSGARGQQLSSRFAVLELKRYVWSDPSDRASWKKLIRGFEQMLQLRDHPVKTLDEHARYLYDRTGGSIGSLGRLLTGAAIDLVQRGADSERLDPAVLDGYTLDLTAENFYRNVLTRKTKKDKTATELVMSA
ncbi:TniB family NTP-binding protein [Microbacterium lushaniae]|uniref:AAA family ATPase n=1 Tax=Microbacterium lushaniae TaxID=2614639 RepID=A0A5J6L854_9MICO|nr:TniB family NTP-binding protein [Microbacterium lushaniae]QEW04638.1 AAA family ATPase [Microbacterium lushaniae]